VYKWNGTKSPIHFSSKNEYDDDERLILWCFVADTALKHPVWKPVVNTHIMPRKRRREEDNNCILTEPAVFLPIQMVNSFY
jgi:hypothetical protein